MTANTENEDSEDLEALFDSIVAGNRVTEAQARGVSVVAANTDKSFPPSVAQEWGSPLPVPGPTEGQSSDEATDGTTGHLTDGTASHSTKLTINGGKVAGYYPAKDTEQAIGYSLSTGLSNNANQVAGYGGIPISGGRTDLSEDSEARAPSSQPPVFTVQSSDVIDQIGHMTRTLHDALRELGLNKKIEKAASSIPDARDRLNYVATLTQQAAERVLNATEAAQPLVEQMEVEAHRLSGQWQMMFEKQLDVEEFKDLATQTSAFLQDVPRQTKATHAYLMEIMMAQDFQDLTGQVIKKIIVITENMEQQLLALLLENAPAKVKAELKPGLLNGPVINQGGRKDVVSSQNRVDDLLESLGF
ncbi:MAG: protein phosphatase CheZ [Gallionella sp.]